LASLAASAADSRADSAASMAMALVSSHWALASAAASWRSYRAFLDWWTAQVATEADTTVLMRPANSTAGGPVCCAENDTGEQRVDVVGASMLGIRLRRGRASKRARCGSDLVVVRLVDLKIAELAAYLPCNYSPGVRRSCRAWLRQSSEPAQLLARVRSLGVVKPARIGIDGGFVVCDLGRVLVLVDQSTECRGT
jgi:hypothetical protein